MTDFGVAVQDDGYRRALLDPSTLLDTPHHDTPERHEIGKALLAPGMPQPIGTAAAGKSPAVARADHVHGPGNHTHNYSDPSHTHAEQVAVGGKRIATGPASGTLNGINTTPAAASTNIMVQGGSVVAATDSTGLINVVYPQIFPNGVISVVAIMGFLQPWIIAASDFSFNNTYHQFRVYSNTSGGTVNNTTIRFNWIAIGW